MVKQHFTIRSEWRIFSWSSSFSLKYVYTGNNNIGEKNVVNIRYYRDEPDEAGPPISGDP